MKYSTPKQLCDTQWSKTKQNHYKCTIAITKELGNRSLYAFPEEKCGLKTIDALPTSVEVKTPKAAIVDQSASLETYRDKVNKLVSTYGVNTISRHTAKNNPDFTLYREIVNEIVIQFKEASKTAEYKDGLVIYKQMNLPFVSKVTWYASGLDTCSESLGTKEMCLLNNGTATCQSIELSVNYKTICVESFTK